MPDDDELNSTNLTGSQRRADVLSRLSHHVYADFSQPGLDFPGITFITYQEWMSDTSPGIAGAGRSLDIIDDPVCVSEGHSFLVPLRNGFSQALSGIASALADDVMDRLNSPWPVIRRRNGVTVVLEPQVDGAGVVVWASSDGEVLCPVGYLYSTLGIAGVLQ